MTRQNSDIQSPDTVIVESRIATLIHGFCEAERSQLGAEPSADLYEAVVRQAITSSEGGKRLRARLLLACFRSLLPSRNGWRDDVSATALDIACAIEIFQTAALVHDDIIDEADTRRGKPAAHRAMARIASGTDDPDTSLGNGLGIMLGDLLATASVAIVDKAAEHLPNRRPIMSAFLDMHRAVEIGQVLDLSSERLPLDDPKTLSDNALEVFRWKTASYTTFAPIRLASLVAGFDADGAERLARSVGMPLGVAFQLADDLLDVDADPARTGKPIGGDIREGKRTVLLADALASADATDADYLRRAFLAPERDERTTARIIDLFHSTGAVARSKQRIRDLWDRTCRSLDAACDAHDLNGEAARPLHEACAAFVPAPLRG